MKKQDATHIKGKGSVHADHLSGQDAPEWRKTMLHHEKTISILTTIG
jgi:hypothetical protein